MSDTPEYRIATLSDFLNVPEDRIEICLAEFVDWITILRNTDALLRTLVPDHPAGQPLTAAESFVWIDDGARNVTMRLDDAEGKRLVDAHWPEGGEASVTLHGPETPHAE